jgi:signal recognition particle subunit SRP54
LLTEMAQIYDQIKPDHTIFVLDASMGQMVSDQVNAFKLVAKIGSILLTKMDSGAKGGGALVATSILGVPISFIGNGEAVDKLSKFNAEQFVNVLMGRGDMRGAYSLMLKTMKPNDVQNGEQIMNRAFHGQMSLRDFAQMAGQFSTLGSYDAIASLLPGAMLMNKANKNFDTSMMKKVIIITDSMTKEELDDPELLLSDQARKSRISRISRGSGTSVMDIDKCLTLFKTYANVMKKGDFQKYMKDFIGDFMNKSENTNQQMPLQKHAKPMYHAQPGNSPASTKGTKDPKNTGGSGSVRGDVATRKLLEIIGKEKAKMLATNKKSKKYQ